jgi:cytosine/adenosine deaminase-related metal-dependent hydrolase
MPAGEIIRADWLASMASPVTRDGAVAFAEGRILAVGNTTEIKERFRDFSFRDLGQAVVMPGLINAHTHLELSECECGEKTPGRFIDWIVRLPQRGRMDAVALEQSIRSSTQAGIEQCLRFGVTCVGDISQYPEYSRAVLGTSPLRAVSYAEVLGSGTRRWRFEKLLGEAETACLPNGRIVAGISPHAPYSVDLAGYRECVALSRKRQMPLATHLAEWPDETEFLKQHAGMFRELLDGFGFWHDTVETYPSSPIQFAQAIGMLNELTLLAHVNYCDDEELALLAAGRASVVYCPRTHRYFRHPPHHWREMLAAGINVAVGTDSCASSPDLNLVDEIRLLHKIAPEIASEQLWQLITVNAARALQRKEIGSLSPGLVADFVAFTTVSDDPLTELLENNSIPTALWIAGQPIR